MKLLLCSHKEAYQGGAEVYWESTRKALEVRGIMVYTITLEKPTAKSIFSRIQKELAKNQFERLLNTIAKFKPDLLHFNKQIVLSNQQKKDLKKRQIPIVLTVHDQYSIPFPINLKNRIKHQFYRFDTLIDYFIIPSKHYYQLLTKKNISNIHYISHFIEATDWVYQPRANTQKQLLFVGRLEEEKGIFLLLNTLKALVEEETNYQLTIVGEGKQKQTLLNRINNLGLTNQVQVVGFKTQRELSDYYNKATLLIVPSLKNELFGLVGIEAQASGLPVIASDLAGIREWCIHKQTGITFKANDGEQLKQQIKRVGSDVILQEELTRNAHKFILHNFSKEKAINQLLDLYKTILDEV